MSLPNTMVAAVNLVKFADQRLEEKYTFNQNKVLIIYDENEEIRKNNEEASKVLNDRGCVIFHAALKKLFESKHKLTLNETGNVTEEYTADKLVSYQTTLTSCNCSFFQNHQSPCAHILFLRRSKSEPIFCLDIIHDRYIRGRSVESTEDNSTNVNRDSDCLNVSFEVDHESEPSDLVLTDRQKYSMVTPILLRIGNLISCHPTKKFLQYLDGLNELEKRVRCGRNFVM